MLLEAVDRPIRYTWPKGELRLEPGKPIKVPDDRGQKVLTRCGDKVRKVSPDWLAAWEELAQVTNNIEITDPRFKPVMGALASCDRTFEQGDWLAFKLAAAQVRAAVRPSTQGKE